MHVVARTNIDIDQELALSMSEASGSRISFLRNVS